MERGAGGPGDPQESPQGQERREEQQPERRQGDQRQDRWRELGRNVGRRSIRPLQSIGKRSMSVWDRIHDRPFTSLGIAIALVACTRPQILHVVIDLPWPHRVQHGAAATLGLGAVVVFLALAAVIGAVLVVPDEDEDQPAHDRERRQQAAAAPPLGAPWRWLAPLGRRIRRSRLARLANLFPALDARIEARAATARRLHVAVGAGFVAAALGWLLLPLLWRASTPPLAVLARQLLLGIGLAGSGAWFLVRIGDAASFRRRLIGRYVFMVTLGLVGGEITWRLPALTGGELSFRFYTIWGVTYLLFLLVATGRMLDLVPRGWRLGAVVLALLVWQLDAGFVVDTGAIKDPARRPAAMAGETAEWFARLERRIAGGRADQPVVLVAASGGGSRAAMFAALVMEYLGHEAFDGRPATTATDAIAHNILAVSSVSGGSLATGYYLRALAGDAESGAGAGAPGARLGPRSAAGGPRHFIATEVAASMVRIANEYRAAVEACGDAAGCAGFGDEEEAQHRRRATFPIVAEGVRGLPERGPPTAPWLFESAFVDDMATDFMAPLLRGVLTPLLERGHSVSDFWAERFAWNGVRQHTCWDGAARAPGDWGCDWSGRRPPPLAMLNTTDVGTGRRVAVDFPPLPSGLLGPSMTSLSDQGGPYDLTLADAVRLSANFPWGFEIGLFRREHYTLLDPALRSLGRRIKLTDGGVTDNSGLDTLASMMEGIELLARPPKTDAIPAGGSEAAVAAKRARSVRELLLDRGVILVEIDSGARPSTAGALGRVFPAITDPLDALSMAGYGGAVTMKTGHVARIRQALERMSAHPDRDPGRGVDRTRRFYHLPFVCNHVDGVMTAWALGPEDKAKLMTLFLVEAESNRQALATYATSTAQMALAVRHETEAARREAGAASKRMAEQLVEELRQGEEERQREETEIAAADQRLLADVAQAVQAGEGPAQGQRRLDDRPPAPAPAPAPQAPPAKSPPKVGSAPQAEPPAPREAAPALPAGRRRGWVYLGHFDAKAGRWLTAYFQHGRDGTPLPPPAQMGAGAALIAVGRSNVRADKPNDHAAFARVQSVVRSGSAVTLIAPPVSWEGTGFIWAEVSQPPPARP